MKKKIYWVGDTKTKQIYTDPYWEKQSAIIHIEETIFPKFVTLESTNTPSKKVFILVPL